MNVSLRQMRAFVQVARCGSFTEAAVELHLTQSATSALVKELEVQLGLALMDRTTRSVRLTQAGDEFRARCERILSDVTHAVADARGLRDKRRGRVLIAASPLAAATYLPGAIAAFAQLHPDVSVELHDILTDGIIAQVHSGAVELGVGSFLKSASEVEVETLFEDRFGVVMPIKHPLAAKRRLRWHDVADVPRISLSESSASRPLIDHTFASLGIEAARPKFEVGYMGTAVALVEAALGIGILPERAASLARSDTTCWRLLNDPVVTQASTLVTRAGRSLSPAAKAFAEFLVGFVQQRKAARKHAALRSP